MAVLQPEPIPWDGLLKGQGSVLDEANTLDWREITNTTEFTETAQAHLLVRNFRGDSTDIEVPTQTSPDELAGTSASNLTETIPSGGEFLLILEGIISPLITDGQKEVTLNVNETLNFGSVTHTGTGVSTTASGTTTDSVTRDENTDLENALAEVDTGYDITAAAGSSDTVTANLDVTPLDSTGSSTGSTQSDSDSVTQGNSASGTLSVSFTLPANTEQIQIEVSITIDGGGDGVQSGTEGDIGDTAATDAPTSDINDQNVRALFTVSRYLAK